VHTLLSLLDALVALIARMKFFSVSFFALVGTAVGQDCSVFKEPLMVMGERSCQQQDAARVTFLFDGMDSGETVRPKKNMDILDLAFHAFSVMQEKYWFHRYGCWPTAIDWTAAFIQTAHSSMTSTLSVALAVLESADLREDMVENLIDIRFAESVAFYFGQHDTDLRYQVSPWFPVLTRYEEALC
jgi:hypothetical protein